MFNNLKIGAKLGLGFGLVLALTVAVGYFGWSGLAKVDNRVDNADGVGDLVTGLKDARILAKEYELDHHAEDADGALASLAGVAEGAVAIKARFNDQYNRDQMDEVATGAKGYADALGEYRRLVETKAGAMTEMRAAADRVLDEAEAIRADQQSQLAERQEANRAFMDDKILKADAANEILMLIMDAKAARVELMYKDDPALPAT